MTTVGGKSLKVFISNKIQDLRAKTLQRRPSATFNNRQAIMCKLHQFSIFMHLDLL